MYLLVGLYTNNYKDEQHEPHQNPRMNTDSPEG